MSSLQSSQRAEARRTVTRERVARFRAKRAGVTQPKRARVSQPYESIVDIDVALQPVPNELSSQVTRQTVAEELEQALPPNSPPQPALRDKAYVAARRVREIFSGRIDRAMEDENENFIPPINQNNEYLSPPLENHPSQYRSSASLYPRLAVPPLEVITIDMIDNRPRYHAESSTSRSPTEPTALHTYNRQLPTQSRGGNNLQSQVEVEKEEPQPRLRLLEPIDIIDGSDSRSTSPGPKPQAPQPATKPAAQSAAEERVDVPPQLQSGIQEDTAVDTRNSPQIVVADDFPATQPELGIRDTLNEIVLPEDSESDDPDYDPQQAESHTDTRDPEISASDTEDSDFPLRVASLIADLLWQPRAVIARTPNERPLFTRRDDFLSIEEFLDHPSLQIPDVLGHSPDAPARGVPRGLNDLDASQRQSLFTGYGPNQRKQDRIKIDVAKDAVPSQRGLLTFDIDSLIARLTSLAAAKEGFKLLTIQTSTPRITSSLHLGKFPVFLHDDADHCRSAVRYIHEIPQVCLGRFAKYDDFEVVCLFPHAIRKEQQTTRLADEWYDLWMNEILLKAIYDVLHSSPLSRIPSSAAVARLQALMRHRESTSGASTRGPRQQLSGYFLHQKYLWLIWDAVLVLINSSPNCYIFRDPLLVLSVKGVKAHFHGSTWREMRQEYTRQMERTLNWQYVDWAFIDVGREWTYPTSTITTSARKVPGETFLWRLKYLEQIYDRFYELDRTYQHKFQTYLQYFLAGTGSATLEPSYKSRLRQAGVTYMQWYNPVKDVFSSGNSYLASNTALPDLSIDPKKIRVLGHLADAIRVDPKRLMQTYTFLTEYISRATIDERHKSFGIRSEFRLSKHMFQQVDTLISEYEALHVEQIPPAELFTSMIHDVDDIISDQESLDLSDIDEIIADLQNPNTATTSTQARATTLVSRRPSQRNQRSSTRVEDSTPRDYTTYLEPTPGSFLNLGTNIYMRWIHWNISRLCYGFEFIYVNVLPGHLISWEQSRAMTMFLKALPCFFGYGTTGMYSRFWYDRYPGRRNILQTPREGMAMHESIESTGFPWFGNKLSWDTLTFKPLHSPYLGFQHSNLESRYKRRPLDLAGFEDCLARVEATEPWLQLWGQNSQCQRLLFDFYFQMCTHLLRVEVGIYLGPHVKEQYRERARLGKIPLCWDSMSKIIDLRYPVKLKTDGRRKLRDFPQLWNTLYGAKPQRHAVDAGYRYVYEVIVQIIGRSLGRPSCILWVSQFQIYLRATCWILPYPGNNRFILRDDKTKAFCFTHYRHLDLQIAAANHRRSVPLDEGWRERYSRGWREGKKGPLLGSPRLERSLIRLPSIELYHRLERLANPDRPLIDEPDEDDPFDRDYQTDSSVGSEDGRSSSISSSSVDSRPIGQRLRRFRVPSNDFESALETENELQWLRVHATTGQRSGSVESYTSSEQ